MYFRINGPEFEMAKLSHYSKIQKYHESARVKLCLNNIISCTIICSIHQKRKRKTWRVPWLVWLKPKRRN